MTLEDFLRMPFMRGAKVLAGERGLSHEVSWCVSDSVMNFGNWVIPGMLLLASGKDLGLTTEQYYEMVANAGAAGIVAFNDREGYAPTADDMSACDAADLPLILMPNGTSLVGFSKRFLAALSTDVSEEFRREEWLRDICKSSGEGDTDEGAAVGYGYNPEYDYYCVYVYPRHKATDPIALEMDATAVRNYLGKCLSLPDAPTLSYMDGGRVTLFAPVTHDSSQQQFRSHMVSIATDVARINSGKWAFIVGSAAESLKEFHASRSGAKQTKRVVEMLEVHEKVYFYDDWYMHMLLLNEPRAELREHMEHVLAPIMEAPDLLETLTNYLVFGENLKETAEKTFIHVNTLKYRLRRIQELLGVDLHDPNVRFRLRMAITIERYLRE